MIEKLITVLGATAILMATACANETDSSDGEPLTTESRRIDLQQLSCTSSLSFFTTLDEEYDEMVERNEASRKAAQEKIDFGTAILRLGVVGSGSSDDTQVQEDVDALFDEPTDFDVELITIEDGFSQVYQGVFAGADVQFVLTYADIELVQLSDGAIAPKPILLPQSLTVPKTFEVSGNALFEECEETGLHCDPALEATYYVYDVTGLDLTQRNMDDQIHYYTEEEIEYTFIYSGTPVSDELAPQTLALAPFDCGARVAFSGTW